MADHDSSFITIETPTESLYKDKGSKFFGYAYPVKTEEEVKEIIESLRKVHHTARHFCFAFRINPKQVYERANDDGEPRNSAGAPILRQLIAHDLVNCLVVVVRYFGGTKLGVSGLVNAYKTAAQMALQSATQIIEEFKTSVTIVFDYNELNDVMMVLKRHNAEVLSQSMTQNVEMTLALREDLLMPFIADFDTFKTVNFKPL